MASPKIYSSRKEMMADIEDIHDVFLLCTHNKTFTFIPKLENIFEKLKYLKNGNIYEIINNSVKHKPYFEYEEVFRDEKSFDKKHDSIIKKIVEDIIKLFQLYHKVNIIKEDVLLMEKYGYTDDGYKFNLHIVVSPKHKTYYCIGGKNIDSSAFYLYTSLLNLDLKYSKYGCLNGKIYKQNQKFEIVDLCKNYIPIDSITLEHVKLSEEQKMRYLVTNVNESLKLIKLNTPLLQQVKYNNETVDGNPVKTNYTKKLLQLVKKKHPSAILKEKVNAYYNFTYTDKDELCPVSGVTHSITNTFDCFETPTGIHFKCNSSKCKNSINIGYIDEEDKFINDAVQIDSKFITESDKLKKIVDMWYVKNKLLAIKSAMGTGKTCMVKQIIESNRFKKILWITHRRSLTRSIYGTFEKYDFVNYMDETDCLFKYDRVIVQIDSLMRISKINSFLGTETFQKYDLVIIDEIESVLSHFSSPFLTKYETSVQDLFDNMVRILYYSKKILFLDADLGIRSKLLIEELGDAVVVNNNFKPSRKCFNITSDNDSFTNYLMNDITSGLKVCVVSMISTYLENIVIKLDDFNKTVKSKKKIIKYILHTSRSDDKLKKKLADVNNFWCDFDVVLYSPTIESGVDFNKKHFDKIYGVIIDGSNTCSQRSFLQMVGRIRQVNTQEIVCLYNNLYQNLKIDKKVSKKLILDGDVYTFNNMLSYFRHYDTLKGKKMLGKYVSETINDKTTFTNNKVHYELTLFDKINIHNEVEYYNKHHRIFATILIKLITKSGNDVKIEQLEKCSETQFDTSLKSQKKIMVNKLMRVDLSKHYKKDLLKKQVKCNLSEEEKLALEKINFMETFAIDPSITKDKLEKKLNSLYGKEIKLYRAELLFGYKQLPDFNKDSFGDGKERVRQKIILDIINYLLGEKYKTVRLDDLEEIVISQDEYIKALKNIVKKSIYFRDAEKYRCLFYKSKSKSVIKVTDKCFQAKMTLFIKSLLTQYNITLVRSKHGTKNKGVRYFKYILNVDKKIANVLASKYCI